jgi:hypothetical protein
MPLRRIYVLEFHNDPSTHRIERLGGFGALSALMGCLRLRAGLIPRRLRPDLFKNLAELSQTVEVFRFTRPFEKARLNEWAGVLASHLDTVGSLRL